MSRVCLDANQPLIPYPQFLLCTIPPLLPGSSYVHMHTLTVSVFLCLCMSLSPHSSSLKSHQLPVVLGGEKNKVSYRRLMIRLDWLDSEHQGPCLFLTPHSPFYISSKLNLGLYACKQALYQISCLPNPWMHKSLKGIILERQNTCLYSLL